MYMSNLLFLIDIILKTGHEQSIQQTLQIAYYLLTSCIISYFEFTTSLRLSHQPSSTLSYILNTILLNLSREEKEAIVWWIFETHNWGHWGRNTHPHRCTSFGNITDLNLWLFLWSYHKLQSKSCLGPNTIEKI